MVTRVWSTDVKVRTDFVQHNNSTTWKNCSVAFIWMVTKVSSKTLKVRATVNCPLKIRRFSYKFYLLNLSQINEDYNVHVRVVYITMTMSRNINNFSYFSYQQNSTSIELFFMPDWVNRGRFSFVWSMEDILCLNKKKSDKAWQRPKGSSVTFLLSPTGTWYTKWNNCARGYKRGHCC